MAFAITNFAQNARDQQAVLYKQCRIPSDSAAQLGTPTAGQPKDKYQPTNDREMQEMDMAEAARIQAQTQAVLANFGCR